MKQAVWGMTLALFLALVTGCAMEPAQVEGPRYSIEDFLETTTFYGASFSPDGSKILVSSDQTGIFNAFAVPVGGGDPVQLTDSTTDSIYAYAYFPNDERFIYGSDEGGNELTHIYVRELDGSSVDLTPGKELKGRFLGWSRDDLSFYMSTNERDGRYFDIYEVDIDSYERSLAFEDNEGYEFRAVSFDNEMLAFDKFDSRTDSDIYVYDRIKGMMNKFTLFEGEISNSAETFGPRGLYYRTDLGAEFKHLMHGDRETGRPQSIEQRNWDVLGANVSKKGTYLVVRINQDAATVVNMYNAQTMAKIPLPELPQGEITSVTFSDDETKIAFYVSSSKQPRDLYVYDLEAGGEPSRLTSSLNPAIDPESLVEAEVVRFDSFDGTTIPGLLYTPKQASEKNPVPALVWVHGGPGGQSRVRYSGLLQYLANHGYAVYAINNRGSEGYGKGFYKLDDRNHGEGDLGDCVASKQMLIDTGVVDGDRIGIIGGSYGGYLVLAALTLQPDAFAVGVDIFGISNWVRTLENIPVYWESRRKALFTEMGDPAEDGERLRRISPLFHADKIARPLLVLQGANDPRVLKVESDEIVEAARANGAVVEYLVFEDEGHGFAKKPNRQRGYKAILDFLDQHLKNSDG